MERSFEPILPRHLLEHFPPLVETAIEDAIKCPVCYEVCVDAIIESACNHTFCKKCVEKLFKQSDDCTFKCPQTRNNVTRSQTGPNRAIREMIHKIKVKCVFIEKGCEWSGCYVDLESHLKNDCSHVKVRCTMLGCDFVGKRSSSERHLKHCEYRPKQCKYCNSYFVASMLTDHEKYCVSQVILCPYGCTTKVKKKDALQHYEEECRNAVLNCEFAEFGCEEKIKRHRYEDHIQKNYQLHLDMMKEKTLFFKSQHTALLNEVNVLRDSTKIDHIKATLKEKDDQISHLKREIRSLETNVEQLNKKNKELQHVVEILNNTEALYEDGVSSNELDEMDQFERAKQAYSDSLNISERGLGESFDDLGLQSALKPAAAMQDSARNREIKKEGYLLKKSKHLGQWRNRWMVLTSNYLFAYEEQNSKANHTEKLLLRNIDQVVEGAHEQGYYIFNIKTKDGKGLYLKSQSRDEVLSWIQELRRWKDKGH